MLLEKETKNQTATSWIETQNEWRLDLLDENRKKLRSFKSGNYTINQLKNFFAPISKKYYGLLEEYIEAKGDGIPEINITLIRFDEREFGVEYEYSSYHKMIDSSSFKLPRLIRKKL